MTQPKEQTPEDLKRAIESYQEAGKKCCDECASRAITNECVTAFTYGWNAASSELRAKLLKAEDYLEKMHELHDKAVGSIHTVTDKLLKSEADAAIMRRALIFIRDALAALENK